jgi:hypothetical protein
MQTGASRTISDYILFDLVGKPFHFGYTYCETHISTYKIVGMYRIFIENNNINNRQRAF